MPGKTTAEVTVFDTAKKLDGVSQTVEVDRFQTDGKQLLGIALFAIKNASTPPRALDSDKTFELVLPAGAVIDSGMAKSPGGQPLNTTPSDAGQKGHYAFSFPLRDGDEDGHAIQVPDPHLRGQRQHCDPEDHHPAADVEPHHQVAAVFAVNEYSGEGQQKQR